MYLSDPELRFYWKVSYFKCWSRTESGAGKSISKIFLTPTEEKVRERRVVDEEREDSSDTLQTEFRQQSQEGREVRILGVAKQLV